MTGKKLNWPHWNIPQLTIPIGICAALSLRPKLVPDARFASRGVENAFFICFILFHTFWRWKIYICKFTTTTTRIQQKLQTKQKQFSYNFKISLGWIPRKILLKVCNDNNQISGCVVNECFEMGKAQKITFCFHFNIICINN